MSWKVQYETFQLLDISNYSSQLHVYHQEPINSVRIISLAKVLAENNEATKSEQDEFPTDESTLRCVEQEVETHPTIDGFEALTDYLPKCLETCGNEDLTEENKFNRIINGITPDVNDWPFLVHLFFYNTPNVSNGLIEGHLCGGTGRVYKLKY